MFYSAEFDPWRLLAQIILLQAVFYATACTILLIFNLIFSIPLHCAILISAKSFAFGQWFGTSIFALTTLTMPLFIRHIVMRAKLCLDFVLTLFGTHILFISLYDWSIPTALYFWGVFGLAILYTVLVSEYLCMQMELNEIPLEFLSLNDTGASKKKKQTTNKKKSNQNDNNNNNNDNDSTHSLTNKGKDQYLQSSSSSETSSDSLDNTRRSARHQHVSRQTVLSHSEFSSIPSSTTSTHFSQRSINSSSSSIPKQYDRQNDSMEDYDETPMLNLETLKLG